MGIAKTLRQSDAQTPIETTRSQIQKMGGIRPSKGDLFEEQQVIPSWIKNAKGRPLDEVADTLGMHIRRATCGYKLGSVQAEAIM